MQNPHPNDLNDDSTGATVNHSVRTVHLVHALWHNEIVIKAVESFERSMTNCGVDVTTRRAAVPGSLELPLACQIAAESKDCDLVVAFGLVVDGGIYRHDFVASTVIDGLMRVQLEQRKPVLSVVLTPHNFQSTHEHVEFFSAHFVTKGQEAAQACEQIFETGVLLS
ncbi:MAG: 6,7-dimethyl-8-ribityllumazine synthase [Pseudomonadota bacterium]